MVRLIYGLQRNLRRASGGSLICCCGCWGSVWSKQPLVQHLQLHQRRRRAPLVRKRLLEHFLNLRCSLLQLWEAVKEEVLVEGVGLVRAGREERKKKVIWREQIRAKTRTLNPASRTRKQRKCRERSIGPNTNASPCGHQASSKTTAGRTGPAAGNQPQESSPDPRGKPFRRRRINGEFGPTFRTEAKHRRLCVPDSGLVYSFIKTHPQSFTVCRIKIYEWLLLQTIIS